MTAVTGTASDSKETDLAAGRALKRQSLIVTFWASLTMFVEGFEMQLVGYAAPAMIAALHADKAEFGVIFGASNFGFFAGALLLSSLGDRFGRRRLIVGGVALFSIGTLAAAYGTTIAMLAVLRFCAGVGLGGAVPNAIALTAEYSPAGKRASRITFLYVTYVLGGAVAGLFASWLIPKFGWQIVFTIGGWGGLLCGFLLFIFVPESRSFLANRKVSPASSGHAPIDAATPGSRVSNKPKTKAPFIALFCDGRLAITLLLWLAYLTAMMASQFVTSWLPTLIAGTGVSLSLAPLIGALYHVGGAAGNIVMGYLTDRRGLKMVAIGFAVAAPVTACMGYLASTLALLALCTLLVGILMVGSLNGINAAAGMLYPTAMRSSGIGWMSGVGRVGSIIGPMVGGVLISLNVPMSTLFLILSAPVAVAAVFMGGLVFFASRAKEFVSGSTT